MADQLAQYGDIDPARARQLLEAEQAAENARREAEQAELERRGEFDAVKKMIETPRQSWHSVTNVIQHWKVKTHH